VNPVLKNTKSCYGVFHSFRKIKIIHICTYYEIYAVVAPGEKTHITTWRNRERKLISRLGAMHILSLFASFGYPFWYLYFKALLSVIYFSKLRSKIQEQIKIMSEIYLAYSVIFARQDLRSNRHVLQLYMDSEKMKQITI
jgi:hypothetical protein